jgi:predicted RNase H-like HicB family nuclease
MLREISEIVNGRDCAMPLGTSIWPEHCALSYSETNMVHVKSEVTGRRTYRTARSQDLQFNIETERETDGRWIAEILEIPGALAYGKTEEKAKANACALALRCIADDVEKSRDVLKSISIGCQSE